MQQGVAHREKRRQDALMVVLATALLATQAFSDMLTRNADGVPTHWPFGALLAVGLIVLTPGRRIALIVIALVLMAVFLV